MSGLTALIGGLEYNRAVKGFASLEGDFSFQPCDIGFDPLDLRPKDAEAFAEMETKELQGGRLAMLGAAGIFAHELVNWKENFVNLGLAVLWIVLTRLVFLFSFLTGM